MQFNLLYEDKYDPKHNVTMKLFTAQNYTFMCLKPELEFGAGADPIGLAPESAPGSWASGVPPKSGGSATLVATTNCYGDKEIFHRIVCTIKAKSNI